MIILGDNSVIPDPDDPENRAIDTKSGDLVKPVLFVPASELTHPGAPTVADLLRGKRIGWSSGLFQ